jgi:hypothetical protein
MTNSFCDEFLFLKITSFTLYLFLKTRILMSISLVPSRSHLSSSLHDSSDILYANLLIRYFKFSKTSTYHYISSPLIFTSHFIIFAQQSVFGSNGILNFVESNFIITRYQLCKASKSNLCDFKLVSLKTMYVVS